MSVKKTWATPIAGPFETLTLTEYHIQPVAVVNEESGGSVCGRGKASHFGPMNRWDENEIIESQVATIALR